MESLAEVAKKSAVFVKRKGPKKRHWQELKAHSTAIDAGQLVTQDYCTPGDYDLLDDRL